MTDDAKKLDPDQAAVQRQQAWREIHRHLENADEALRKVEVAAAEARAYRKIASL